MCKYKYKLDIKEAAAEANRLFNDDLYYKMCTKDDQAFWMEIVAKEILFS